MAGLCAPLSTLRRCPRGHLRMTRGRCGSLLLHRDGLAPSTPCRSPGALRVTPQSGHRLIQLACRQRANCRHGTLIDHLVGARNHTTPRGSFEASNDLSRQKTQRRTTCIALFSCVLLSSAGTTSCKLECRVPFFPCKLCSYKH